MYRSKLAMMFAEAFGTAALTFVVLSVSLSPVGLPFFTSIAAGFTLGLMVLVVGNASGAHLNPAITLGLWTIRKIPALQAVAYFFAQFLGALGAWGMFTYLTQRPVDSIAGGGFDWRILIAEAVGTLFFGFAVAAVVSQRDTGVRAAWTVGTALFIGILIASVAANGILNPAVAVGVRSLSRAYIIGPLVGSIIGMNLYALFFAAEPFSVPNLSRKRRDNAAPAKAEIEKQTVSAKPAGTAKPAASKKAKSAKKKK